MQPGDQPSPKALTRERWFTVFVFVAARLVYLSLILQRVLIFVVEELACLFLAPAVIWLERGRNNKWWHARSKCPACGHDRIL